MRDIFNNREEHCLFSKIDAGHFARATLDERYTAYNNMLNTGVRMLASVAAINRWLARVNAEYSPILTAYNLAFDIDKMRNTGIDAEMFDKRFCLWYASFRKWAFTKQYRESCLQLHAFNTPTKLNNMSFKTNAETMCRFVTGNLRMPDEPHTALEDARDYELPILLRLVQTTKKKDFMEPEAFNWRQVQVKDWFIPK